MQITEIQAQKRDPNKVSFFVDGAFSFSLTIGQYSDRMQLKVGYEMAAEELESLKTLHKNTKLKLSLIDWIYRRPRSKKEVLAKLKLKGVGEEQAESICTELETAGYLNDLESARWWVDSRSGKPGWSRSKVRGELKLKGIDAEQIEAALGAHFDDDAEKAKIQDLVRKKSKRYATKDKLISYLVGKGFRYADIRSALDEMGVERNSEESLEE